MLNNGQKWTKWTKMDKSGQREQATVLTIRRVYQANMEESFGIL